MDTAMSGKTALVTGGSSGIGLAIAQALADEGVHVAVASRNPETAVVRDLENRAGRAVGIQADVSQEDDVQRMVQTVKSEFDHLDYYVNNAARATHQPLTQIDTETFRTILDTNLSACLWACREVARLMIPRGTGGILVVGSTSMYTPGPTETVYRITKFGLKSLVQSAAVELASHGIRVNLLVPGHYRTRLTEKIPQRIEEELKHHIPLRRFGATSDCGHAAVFLLSDVLSGYTTGAELVVDGGLSLRPMFFGSEDELQQLNVPE